MPSEFTAPGAPVTDDERRTRGLSTDARAMLDESATRHGVPDPDLDGLDAEEPSDLDDLRAELDAEVTPTTVIENLGRRRYSARFRTNFTGRDLDSLRKRSADKRFTDKIDGIKFGALLLASTCVEVLRDGKPLADALEASGPVTFTSPELQELMGTGNADETVRKFYGREGYVDAAARRLMEQAGWGDEAYAADPTE